MGQPADLGTRFLARLIDYILLFIVNAIISSVIIFGAIFSAAQGGALGGGGFGPTAVTAIVAAAIYLGYFAFMESNQGKTVGKMLLKLETRGPGGGKPTMEEAVKRNAWVALGIIGVIPFVGWFLAPLVQLAAAIYIAVTINNDTVGRKGWHDQFAGGTQVIKVG